MVFLAYLYLIYYIDDTFYDFLIFMIYEFSIISFGYFSVIGVKYVIDNYVIFVRWL